MITDWPYEFPGAYWLDEKEEEAVLDVLRRRTLFRHYGPDKPRYVLRFEEEARKFYGVKYALAVNSGTGALATALQAMGTGPGDEVIMPAFMWISTASTVVHQNAIPVICEIDDSFTMDPEDLEKKITPRTRLILPVHMAGVPSNMAAIMEVARRHAIPVLEDVAQANGGTFQGCKLGTFGDMGIFSLQTNKNMTAGEGGLVVTNDRILYERAFAGHDMGYLYVDGKSLIPPPHAVMWPAGRRMAEVLGAIASVQITKLPRIIEHMRASKKRMKEMLSGTPGLTFRRLNDPQGDTGPFLIILLEDEGKALRAAYRMKESGLHNIWRLAEYKYHIYCNIPALVEKTPLSPAGNPWNLEANRESVYDYGKGACPRSDELFARGILIPVPSCLTEEQEKGAAEAIKEAAG
ncbi:MAG: DegT/DnrJ/EryC1/StrS family aminotransferase [Candidatus Latescibacter sp.]|nr:DegT/DnrJ/EryC1/StrS family aminotransferase [Candidatus Latescibacter sp.]